MSRNNSSLSSDNSPTMLHECTTIAEHDDDDDDERTGLFTPIMMHSPHQQQKQLFMSNTTSTAVDFETDGGNVGDCVGTPTPFSITTSANTSSSGASSSGPNSSNSLSYAELMTPQPAGDENNQQQQHISKNLLFGVDDDGGVVHGQRRHSNNNTTDHLHHSFGGDSPTGLFPSELLVNFGDDIDGGQQQPLLSHQTDRHQDNNNIFGARGSHSANTQQQQQQLLFARQKQQNQQSSVGVVSGYSIHGPTSQAHQQQQQQQPGYGEMFAKSNFGNALSSDHLQYCSTQPPTASHHLMDNNSTDGSGGFYDADCCGGDQSSSNIAALLSEFDTIARNNMCDPNMTLEYFKAKASATPYTDITNCRKSSSHIKRPMNAFMVWSKEERRKISDRAPDTHNAEISKQLGMRWRQLPEEVRAKYNRFSQMLQELHRQQYPDYKYKPRKKIKKPQPGAVPSTQQQQPSSSAQHHHAIDNNHHCHSTNNGQHKADGGQLQKLSVREQLAGGRGNRLRKANLSSSNDVVSGENRHTPALDNHNNKGGLLMVPYAQQSCASPAAALVSVMPSAATSMGFGGGGGFNSVVASPAGAANAAFYSEWNNNNVSAAFAHQQQSSEHRPINSAAAALQIVANGNNGYQDFLGSFPGIVDETGGFPSPIGAFFMPPSHHQQQHASRQIYPMHQQQQQFQQPHQLQQHEQHQIQQQNLHSRQQQQLRALKIAQTSGIGGEQRPPPLHPLSLNNNNNAKTIANVGGVDGLTTATTTLADVTNEMSDATEGFIKHQQQQQHKHPDNNNQSATMNTSHLLLLASPASADPSCTSQKIQNHPEIADDTEEEDPQEGGDDEAKEIGSSSTNSSSVNLAFLSNSSSSASATPATASKMMRNNNDENDSGLVNKRPRIAKSSIRTSGEQQQTEKIAPAATGVAKCNELGQLLVVPTAGFYQQPVKRRHHDGAESAAAAAPISCFQNIIHQYGKHQQLPQATMSVVGENNNNNSLMPLRHHVSLAPDGFSHQKLHPQHFNVGSGEMLRYGTGQSAAAMFHQLAQTSPILAAAYAGYHQHHYQHMFDDDVRSRSSAGSSSGYVSSNSSSHSSASSSGYPADLSTDVSTITAAAVMHKQRQQYQPLTMSPATAASYLHADRGGGVPVVNHSAVPYQCPKTNEGNNSWLTPRLCETFGYPSSTMTATTANDGGEQQQYPIGFVKQESPMPSISTTSKVLRQ